MAATLWDTIQDQAFKLDPTLTGDQLDRVGNILMDLRVRGQFTDATVRKVIRRVKGKVMAK